MSYSDVVRSDTEDKVDYLLVRDGPLYQRWARHMSYWASRRGGKRNWMAACTQADLDRFRESLLRHTEQFLAGEQGEEGDDHAAAICFNLNGCLYVQERLEEQQRKLEAQQEFLRVWYAHRSPLQAFLAAVAAWRRSC